LIHGYHEQRNAKMESDEGRNSVESRLFTSTRDAMRFSIFAPRNDRRRSAATLARFAPSSAVSDAPQSRSAASGACEIERYVQQGIQGSKGYSP